MDILNADLWLENKASEAKPTKKKAAAGKKSKPKRKKPDKDSGFHFTAYVPIRGHIWELDGLKPRPVDHGLLSLFSGSPSNLTRCRSYFQ
jgi:ubiquitin carboxyl-terminal hydrolase L5